MTTKSKQSTFKLLLIALMAVFMLAGSTQSVSARGFGGGGHSSGGHSSGHSSGGRSGGFTSNHSVTRPSGNYRSPATPTKPSTSSGASSTRSYHVTRNPSTNRQSSTTTHNTYNNYNGNRGGYQREGLGTMFGHSIVRGAGWSIGSHMGDSIWHQTFGFGGNQYYDNQGRIQTARPGFSGWFVLLFIILAIALTVYIVRRVRNNSHTY